MLLVTGYLSDCYSIMFVMVIGLACCPILRVYVKCGMVVLIACGMLLVTNSRVCFDESVRVVLIDN